MGADEESLIAEGKANTHLTHLEELVLTQGPRGYQLARAFLLELLETLKGNSKSRVQTSVKWDGAPAIFVGINPENGKFFVGTKSIFNKEPKINYTKEDILRNHGHAPGLVDKLEKALDYLPSLGINKILQGDFMFDDEMLDVIDINGEPHYRFKPNTIVYAVPVDSKLGEEIGRSKFGIVFHTTYDSLDSGASYGADVSSLNRVPGIWFDDAFFTDDTGTVTLTENEESHVKALVKEADSVNKQIDYRDLPSDFLNIYINSEIKGGEFLEDPAESFEGFKNWFSNRQKMRISKLKRPENQKKAENKLAATLESFDQRQEDILNLFKVSRLLFEAKNVFISKYNNAVYNTKHFVDDGSGDLRVTNPEGYVAVDHAGNGVKFVDRLEFSRANFAMDKGFTKEAVQESDTSALTIVWDSEQRSTTAPLAEWKKQLHNVSPRGHITINRNNKQESVMLDDSIAKLIVAGTPLTSLVPSPEDGKKALKKTILYVEEIRKHPLSWAEGLTYTETLLTDSNTEEPATVYIPGGFKPPHRGHLSIVRQAAQRFPNSSIRVVTGRAGKKPDEIGREGITLEMAAGVWDQYFRNDPMLQGKDVDVITITEPLVAIDSEGEPRRRAKDGEIITTYSPIEKIAQDVYRGEETPTIAVVYSKKDLGYGDMVKTVLKRLDEEGKLLTLAADVSSGAGDDDLSATNFRKAIKENDFETFKLFLPEFYNEDEIGAREIFATLGGTLEEVSVVGGAAGTTPSVMGHMDSRRRPTRKDNQNEQLVNEVADYLLGITVG